VINLEEEGRQPPSKKKKGGTLIKHGWGGGLDHKGATEQ